MEGNTWKHPGGKLREKGPDQLTDEELLSILIGTGTKERSSKQIAHNLMQEFDSFKGLANQPLERLSQIKGLGDVKIIRIAASFEMAKRIVNEVLDQHEQNQE